MRLALLASPVLAGVLLCGCQPGAGGVGSAVGADVTIHLRLVIQGYSTVAPVPATREESHLMSEVSGKLLSADGEWLVVENASGTTYIRKEAVITVQSTTSL